MLKRAFSIFLQELRDGRIHTEFPNRLVKPPAMAGIEPDRAALEIAHQKLQTAMPLDDMLRVPNLRATLFAVAHQHMLRRARVDVQKLRANDHE